MIASELLKIRSTVAIRILLAALVIGTIAVQALNIFAPALLTSVAQLESATPSDEQEIAATLSAVSQVSSEPYQRAMLDLLGTGPLSAGNTPGVAVILALLLGVLVATSEFRFGGIITTALGSPNRLRIALSKMVTVSIIAIVGAAVVAVLAALALLVATLAVAQVPIVVDPLDAAGIWARGTAVLVLYAVIGVAVGLLIRQQVAAVITVFAVAFLEPLVPLVLTLTTGSVPAWAALLPIGLGEAASSGAIPLAFDWFGTAVSAGPVVALIALAVWGAVLAAASAIDLRRRDLA